MLCDALQVLMWQRFGELCQAAAATAAAAGGEGKADAGGAGEEEEAAEEGSAAWFAKIALDTQRVLDALQKSGENGGALVQVAPSSSM